MNLRERIADTLWTLSWYNDYADERRHVLLFSILILGQNVVSYNVQNELRLVKKGFPLRYSLKEKLQCKSVIGRVFKTKSKWKIIYFIPIPDRYAEHDTHKAVSIQIVGTVVCGMVKQFWNIFKFCAKFRYHRIINTKKYRLCLQEIRYQFQGNPGSDIHKSGIINLCIGTCIVKCIQWFFCYSG